MFYVSSCVLKHLPNELFETFAGRLDENRLPCKISNTDVSNNLRGNVNQLC